LKKRIAIWIYGGIGTGHFAQGYPMLEKLIEHLSDTFEIVVYSASLPAQGFNNERFSIRSAPASVKMGLLRWFYLTRYFVGDHRKEKFNLVFGFWGYPSGVLVTFLGKMLKIQSAIYLLGSDSAGIPSIDFGIMHKPLLSRLAKWAYQRATMVLAISKFQKDTLACYGVTRLIHVIPWGADASSYRFKPKTRNGELHVIHVGHLTPVKDQATLLKAFALLLEQHPAKLKIFGVDCLNGKMQGLCAELKIDKHVEFLDMIPYHQMPEQYSWADVMFHTSVSEGQSMALTEAAACGVLLAGTRVGLLYDLGEHYGITVEKGDYQGLSNQVLAILQRPEEWERKIKAARQWSQDHDLTWTVSELKKVLQAL
jgi:glycosyltransferase involved in cell wall biosynthesis